MDETAAEAVVTRVYAHPDLVFRNSKRAPPPTNTQDQHTLLKALLTKDPALFLGTSPFSLFCVPLPSYVLLFLSNEYARSTYLFSPSFLSFPPPTNARSA